ncbi:MAG: SDR family oxidoreductase [Planctomycetaceae bacterium]|nr:SDR family oxidoreductase [Planctomycetaceae bacterium]
MILSPTDKPNRIAVVTGAGSGIGQHVAWKLNSEGFTVVLAGRRESALHETARQAEHPSRMLTIPTDVTHPESVDRLFNTVKNDLGRLDVLFNNAGINAAAVEIDELPLETWKKVVDVNLTGVFLCTQAAFRLMKSQNPQGGRIINNGSISAHVPRPLSIAYTATKHAVTGLTKSTSLDGRSYGICCGQIDIGNAATDMTSRMSGGVRQADGSISPEPTMNVQHVADAVAYLAQLPLDVNVPFVTVMANGMPYIGRG